MNKYATLAESHWRTWLPDRYAAIRDRNSFFSELGQEVSGRIASLELDLLPPEVTGEDFLARVGRRNMARLQAEEIVLREMVLLPAETGPGHGGRGGRAAAGVDRPDGDRDGRVGGISGAAGRWRPPLDASPRPSQTTKVRDNLAALRLLRPDGYLLRHDDGTFGRVLDAAVQAHAVPRTQVRELGLLLALRDTYVELVESEAADLAEDAALDARRARLNRDYDSYTAIYGPINPFSWQPGRTNPGEG